MIYVATSRNLAKTTEIMSHIKNRVMDQEIFATSKGRRNPFLGKRGTVAILVGLSAPALVLAIGLGIEASGWSALQQRLQRTADMAALAGALAYNKGASASVAATQAAYTAEINGSTGVTSPATRTWLPTPKTLLDGSITIQEVNGVRNAGDIAFAATVQDSVPLLFSAIALPGPGITLSATGIAELVSGGAGKFCVLVLDPTDQSLTAANAATVNATQCGIQINSTATSSASVQGSASLHLANFADSSTTAPCSGMSGTGTFGCPNSGSITVTQSDSLGAQPVANPYANVAIPTPGPCISGGPFHNTTISQGTYCNGLSTDYGTVNMQPGVYVINGGNFAPGGGSTVNGTGVTIILTGSNPGTVQVGNGITLNLTAPTTGPTFGIAILGMSTSQSGIQGGASMNITGALVFPNSKVQFANGTTTSSPCTKLIAYQVDFEGGASFNNNCTGTGTLPIGANTTAQLVE
jgi:Flp pilus assembly protein TadG